MGDLGGAAQAGANVVDTAATNATNLEIARQNNAFNAQQAGLNRSFQDMEAGKQMTFQESELKEGERYNTLMANTSMQRRVNDLRAAGLNPLLAMGALGGAQSPTAPTFGGASGGGSQASSAGLPDIRPMTAGLAGAMTAGKQQELLDAQADNVRVDTMRKTAELPYAGAQASQAVEQLRFNIQNLKADTDLLNAKFDFTVNESAGLMQNQEFQRELFPLQQRALALDNQAKKYGLPELATQSWFWQSALAAPIYAGQQGNKMGLPLGVGGAGAAAAAAGLKSLKWNSDPNAAPDSSPSSAMGFRGVTGDW